MDYTQYLKRLQLPPGRSAPRRLVHEDIVASAINRKHLQDDVRGINESVELIRRTRGGSWPTEPVSEEFNFVDLVWHECEFRDEKSFTYAVYNTAGQYLGCCYLYPIGSRTKLTEALTAYDVDVSWWVTPTAYDRGDYTKLHRALQHWLETEFPFWRPHYSNSEIPQ